MLKFIKRNFVYIVLILALSVNFFGYAKTLFTTPFIETQDLFSHIKYTSQILETNQIDFMYNTDKTEPPLYQYFPFFHVTMAAVSQVTSLELPYVAVFLNLIMIIIIPLLLYHLATLLFKKKIIGLFTALFFMFPGSWFKSSGSMFFKFTGPPWFSVILYLTVLIIIYYLYNKNKNLKYLYIIYPIIVFSMMLYHPQSSIGRVAIISLLHLLFYFFTSEKRLKNRAIILLILSILPGLFFLAININNIDYFLIVGDQFTETDNPLVQSATVPKLNSLNNSLGQLVFIFGMIGLFYIYFIKNSKFSKLTKILIASMIITNLLGMSQRYLGLNFFVHRYQAELFYPAILLAAMGIYYILTKIKFGYVIIIPVLFTMIISPVVFLYSKNFPINWNYVKAMVWAKDNIKYSKVMADPYTYYTFKSIGVLKSPYRAIRPGSKEYNRLQAEDPAYKNIFQGTVEQSYFYAKEHGVEYIIIDYKNNKGRLAVNYDNFTNESYYKEIYSIALSNDNPDHWLSIYKLIK